MIFEGSHRCKALNFLTVECDSFSICEVSSSACVLVRATWAAIRKGNNFTSLRYSIRSFAAGVFSSHRAAARSSSCSIEAVICSNEKAAYIMACETTQIFRCLGVRYLAGSIWCFSRMSEYPIGKGTSSVKAGDHDQERLIGRANWRKNASLDGLVSVTCLHMCS